MLLVFLVFYVPSRLFCLFCFSVKVLASGKAADSPALETATTASSTASVDDDCSTGAGPVLGFSTSYSQVGEEV